MRREFVSASWPRVSLACRSRRNHLDLGHDLLGIKLAGDIKLAVEKFEVVGEARVGLLQDVDVLRDLLGTRLEHAELGRDHLRRDLAELGFERGTLAAIRFRLEARNARRHRSTAFTYLAKLRGEVRVVDAHERLALFYDRAFLDQDLKHDAAFQRLHDLHLLRGNDAPGAALHLVENREVRPHEHAEEHAADREQQHARGARRFQLDRGANVIDVGKIRVPHRPCLRHLSASHPCPRHRGDAQVPHRAVRPRPGGPYRTEATGRRGRGAMAGASRR